MNLFALFFHAFLANSIPYRIVKLDPTSSIICFSTKFNQHENMFQDIALLVGLTLIQAAHAKGAVCLDGTLPGYHLHRGYGSGSNSWLINLEGGGWCNDVRTCVYRKTTRRGSSSFMEKEIPFTGILSNNAEENSDFFNWNRVKLRYCDGASFTGNSEDKGVQKNLPRICTNHLDPTSGIAVATKAQFDSTDLALLELAWIQLIQENKPVTKKELAKSDSQDAYAKKAI